jgi:ATP-dependent RNA helicase DeaD
MARFRTGATELLIATDVAARGIDVEHLTHVVNYDVPSSPDAYVHRIGRVGRAGRAGVAITIAEPREQRMLQAIEAVTEQRIAIERLPTVADLRERRLERTREALQESLERDDLEQFRAVVESLAEEADLMDVALAAVRLAHESLESGAEDAEEIPQRDPEASRPRRDGPPAAPRPSGEGMARLWVGLGREAGVRPQDLVGAIANESGISGRSIGGIQIEDRFSLVEVPAGDAQRVIDALRGTTIKGRKANVRRDRHGDSDGRGRPGGGSRSTRVRRSK